MSGQISSGPIRMTHAHINLTTQSNLNDTPLAWREVLFDVATLDSNIPGIVATTTGLFVPAGMYYASMSIQLFTSVERANVHVRFTIDTVQLTSPFAAMGYIRGLDSHLESSLALPMRPIVLPVPGLIGAVGVRAAQAGTVFTIGNGSGLSLMKVE